MTAIAHSPTNSQILALKKLKSSKEESGISPRISRITSIFFLAKFAKSQRVSTYHANLHESFLSSLGQSVVCCPLSVVKFQKSVSIREIRGVYFANFASLREKNKTRFARFVEKHARYVEAIRELYRIFAKKRTMELKLRAVDLSDADLFYEWENEISLWESGNTMRPFSRYALENYVLTSQNEPLEVAKQMRLMLDACSEDMIVTLGCVDLYDFDFRDSKAAVGIFICESERRKGYARKAVALLCDYVSRIYNLNQLYAFVASDNSESRSLFSACGFEQTACLKQWIQRGNVFKDVVLYQKILRNENK